MADAEIKGVNSGFKTLLAYGRSVSGVGWFIFVIGVILIALGIGGTINNANHYGGGGAGSVLTFGPYGIIAGLILSICGVMLVVTGQLISCLVSIERNTRGSWDILKRKEGAIGN